LIIPSNLSGVDVGCIISLFVLACGFHSAIYILCSVTIAQKQSNVKTKLTQQFRSFSTATFWLSGRHFSCSDVILQPIF